MRFIPVVLSGLLIGAHFLRSGQWGLVALSISAPLLLFSRRSWIPPLLQGLLLLAAAKWVQTTLFLIQLRQALGQPWTRLAMILGAVALLTAASTLVFRRARMKSRFSLQPNAKWPAAIAFALTGIALGLVQLKVMPPMLLAERFAPNFGWLQIAGLGLYAAWITEQMLDPATSARWRLRIWLIFSVVFFGQLALGLAGAERLLMSGELHLPVPAVIVAGPLYRGHGLFMPILFGSTLLLTGPAWCSHLCYIGAWDGLAARQKKPRPLPSWTRSLRIGILIVVLGAALLLRMTGVSTGIAAALAIGFGIAGVAIMAAISTRTGAMVHCTVYCPIGVLADYLGRLNPFRVRLKEGCTSCLKCAKSCRYDALSPRDIERRRPAVTCTLCGDCLAQCKDRQIEYRFLSFKGRGVRTAFIVLIVATHTVFMGVARM